eukprot:2767695-Pleurochrysis_carterae.AAC.1
MTALKGEKMKQIMPAGARACASEARVRMRVRRSARGVRVCALAECERARRHGAAASAATCALSSLRDAQ